MSAAVPIEHTIKLSLRECNVGIESYLEHLSGKTSCNVVAIVIKFASKKQIVVHIIVEVIAESFVRICQLGLRSDR